MRVLVVGDVHGNTAWVVEHVVRGRARREGVRIILQVGDFGVWPGDGGRRYLDAVDRALEATGAELWFIDGNHEDFDQLLALPVDDDGRRVVRPRIHHLPRGYRWEWEGRRFLACGGAGSVDVEDRTPRVSWWPQELITDDDVARCIAGGGADVLVCHDAPAVVSRTFPHHADHWPWGNRGRALADASRERLDEITQKVAPSLIIHGHWHHAHRTAVAHDGSGAPAPSALGLQADGDAAPGANHHCAILDTDVLSSVDDLGDAVTFVD